MNNVEFVDLKLEHIRFFGLDKIKNMELSLPGAKTMLVDGEPVACGGIAHASEGMGEAWLHANPDMKFCLKIKLLRYVNNFFNLNIKSFRRVQAVVLDGHFIGMRLAKKLGFEFEGFMKKFSPDGRTGIRYGRVN